MPEKTEKQELFSGDDWVFDVLAFDIPALGAPATPEPPFDLSGATLYFTMKLSPDDPDPGEIAHDQFVPASTLAEDGKARLFVPNAKTRLAAPSSYKAQIVAVRPGPPSFIVTLDEVAIRVKPRLRQTLP